MVRVDWGAERPPLHVPGLLHTECDPLDTDDPAAMPAVRAAQDHGYEPAPEAPLWCFLPAIWPEAHRAWVRDTRVRHQSVTCDGEPGRRVPWTAADHAEVEADINDLLAECGVTSRPAGRVWLLRPPPGLPTLDAVLDRLVAVAQEHGHEVMATPAFVEAVDLELRRLFDDHASGHQP